MFVSFRHVAKGSSCFSTARRAREKDRFCLVADPSLYTGAQTLKNRRRKKHRTAQAFKK